MRIYTIVETEESFSDPLSARAVGSYGRLPMARGALIDHVVRRAQEDARFSSALWKDENRGDELRGFMRDRVPWVDSESYFCRDDGKSSFPAEVVWFMRKFISDNVEGEEAYHIFYGCGPSEHTIHLDIIENEYAGGIAG